MRTSILRNALRNGAVCQSDGMALCSYLYLRPNITWNFCRNETATATVWLSAPTTFVSQIHNNTNTNRPISSNRSAKFTTWKKIRWSFTLINFVRRFSFRASNSFWTGLYWWQHQLTTVTRYTMRSKATGTTQRARERQTDGQREIDTEVHLLWVCNLDTVDRRHTLRNAASHYVAHNTSSRDTFCDDLVLCRDLQRDDMVDRRHGRLLWSHGMW